MADTRKGPTNPRWRGGRTISTGGYVMVSAPDHPRASNTGYVREHVLVAERALGRALPPSAVVHHTGKQRDNTALVVCNDQAYHNLLHQRARALAACGRANWRRCVRCKRYDEPTRLVRHSRSAMVHPSCANTHTKRMQSREK